MKRVKQKHEEVEEEEEEWEEEWTAPQYFSLFSQVSVVKQVRFLRYLYLT